MPQERPDLAGRIADDTPNFLWHEVRCRHCQQLPDDLQAVINQARMMQKVRAVLGNVPLKIHSWFRCPAWNAAVGGASDSQHLRGRACDFTTKTLSPRQVAAKLRSNLGEGKPIGGLGSYPGFVHIDNRPEGRGAYWRE